MFEYWVVDTNSNICCAVNKELIRKWCVTYSQLCF